MARRRNTAESPATPQGPANPDAVVVSDVRAIRALAHPARLAVLDALADGEELTATECAGLAGLSPSAMSYHLRALEKWGLVERAPTGEDGRERPWRTRGRDMRIAAANPATSAAVEAALLDTVLDTDRQALLDHLARRHREPAGWVNLMSVSRSTLWVTAAEAAAIREGIDAILDRYRARQRRPAGARRIRLNVHLVPLDEVAEGQTP